MGGMGGIPGYMSPESMHMMNSSRHTKLGRGVSDPAAYAHKLFVGQIPFEVGGWVDCPWLGYCRGWVLWQRASAAPCLHSTWTGHLRPYYCHVL
jgi:hypothetical protein